jgi:dTDP-4-dehydrorhamnose 3,5-epimerase
LNTGRDAGYEAVSTGPLRQTYIAGHFMKIEALTADGVLLVEPKRICIAGGFSCESYNAELLATRGANSVFLCERTELRAASGAVTGLHYQRPPFAQAHLIRVIRGAIFAAAVDLRKDSATFGRSASAELTAENNRQLYCPPGFAFGYATLRPLTEILCKSSLPHSAAHRGGIYWDDPALRIGWPISAEDAVIAMEDRSWPLFANADIPFMPNAHDADAAA